MNHLIKALYDQSLNQDSLDAKRFAELIVNEFVSVCEELAAANKELRTQMIAENNFGGACVADGAAIQAKKLALEIKTLFGVK